MKKYLFIALTFVLFSCDKNNNVVSENPNIPNYPFSIDINTSLPLYNSLLFSGNALLINTAGAGVNGVFIIKVGDGDYRAFEATCPNQAITTCSKMTRNGVNGVCPCDNREYSLYTGVVMGDSSGLYPLKSYRVELNLPNIRVYN
jgi:nitrite reductase/ring-hydroxylating ferredoxin subunit